MISTKPICPLGIAAVVLFLFVSAPANAAEQPVAEAAALIEKGQKGELSEADWIRALQSEVRLIREAAVSLTLRGGHGDAFIPSAETMGGLDSATRAQLLSVLGMRGNTAALPAIRPSLRAEDARERTAAVLAAGELSDVASQDILIELAVSDDSAAETARHALPRLAGHGIDEALMKICREGTSKQQTRALEVLAARGYRPVVPEILAANWLDDPDRSEAAADALGALGTDEEFAKILEESINRSGAVQTQLKHALARIVLTSDTPQTLLATLKSRVAREDTSTQISYIAFHGYMQCEAAIEALEGYSRDSNPDIVKRAIRTLAAWNDAGSVDTLLGLADSNNEIVKQAAIEALSIVLARRKVRDKDLLKNIETVIKSGNSKQDEESGKGEKPVTQERGGGTSGESVSASADEAWVPLFNGKNLNGWHALPGSKWFVLDGQLIGIGTKEEKRHSLLLSDKRYTNFRLRVEFMSVLGNSGLYFRTEKIDHPVGVKGFQAEIAPTGLANGGLYETLGRAWVTQPDREVIKTLFKQYDWNTMEVVAIGGDIQVILNGTKVCEVKDDPGLPEGHIGLQMHGNGDMDIRFRKVEIMEISQ